MSTTVDVALSKDASSHLGPGTERMEGAHKTVVRKARLVRHVETWTEEVARLFAADCAQMLPPPFEVQHPEDNRVRHAIEVARAHARGEADDEDMKEARGAACGAARGAVRAPGPSAAWNAVRAAGADAARGAARCAIRTGEGPWVVERLAEYLERGAAAAAEPDREIEG